LSQERVLKTLISLGFSETDAKIYVFLSKKGLQKGREISKSLKISKQFLYPCLKNLQSKGIVSVTLEHPARFSAMPFEKVLDFFVKSKIEEAQRFQSTKDEILSDWQSIIVNTEDNTPKFMVLEGRSRIYARIKQMIQQANNQVLTVTTVSGLAQADQLGLLDGSAVDASKEKAQFRFLTELNPQNVDAIRRFLKELTKANVNFQGRNPFLGLKAFPRMVIRDNEEILFFINPLTDISKVEQDDSCLWTDCKTIVSGFAAIFEELWHNSVDIQRRIVELETHQVAGKTIEITDQETGEREYNEKLKSAKEEIVAATSAQGIIELWNKKEILEKVANRGVSVRVMAPIVRENLKVAEQLSKIANVRHVSSNYVGVTLVDRKHLFQSEANSKHQNVLTPHFYTCDLQYIEEIGKTLDNIWKTSQSVSAVTLESITGPTGPMHFPFFKNPLMHPQVIVLDKKPPGVITEKDILNKIVNAKKHQVKDLAKDLNVMYATGASAVIHPPDDFGLPDLLFFVHHIEKQSSLGAADVLEVHLWLETPEGYRFVVCGGLGDNPRGVAFRRAAYAGTPFEKNYQYVSKDKLQVRVYGNTLFAGWTVPIPLLPPKYVLPPGCLTFEGHGEVKTKAFSYVTPTGLKTELEQNWFDAFVTFMHPASKYSGPGTDGSFVRDLILTMIPPDRKHFKTSLTNP